VPVRASGLAVLARACHPLPALGVTAFLTVLAAVAGNSAGTCVVVAAAVLFGQLSVGWSNDLIDRDRDRATGRRDKPLARPGVSARPVAVATGVAVAATVVLSLLLGIAPGLVHLAAVACAWLYNSWLKATVLSWLPYALAFGATPAVATLALPGSPAPAPWAVAAAALLGVTAHLANTVTDFQDDRATGVVGAPHRLGARASLVLAGVLSATASVLLVLGPPEPPPTWGWAVLALASLVTVSGLAAAGVAPPNSRLPFRAIMAVAALDLLLVIAAGHSLVG
jgi:4-hydroxybenzoate polyprenyltransferase